MLGVEVDPYSVWSTLTLASTAVADKEGDEVSS
jgi:hypothetical protein